MKLFNGSSKNNEANATSNSLPTASHSDKRSRKDMTISNEILNRNYDKNEQIVTDKQAAKLV